VALVGEALAGEVPDVAALDGVRIDSGLVECAVDRIGQQILEGGVVAIFVPVRVALSKKLSEIAADDVDAFVRFHGSLLVWCVSGRD